MYVENSVGDGLIKSQKMDLSAGRQVTVSQRRYLQIYRHVAFILQILSAVATTATFIRISEQHHLPPIFLALPSLLFLLTAIGRCLQLQDSNITAIVIGATTGAIAGFLSSVVVRNDNLTSVSTLARSEAVTFMCTLEFLHIPVVAGTVMFSFCLLFSRLPPLTLVIIAAAAAACATVILFIGFVLVNDPMIGGFNGGREFSIISHLGILAETFLGIFIVALMPALRTNKRAWLICIACFTVSSHWQWSFLDSVQWKWEKSYFPIPGSLFAIIVLFMVDIIEMSETADLTLRRSRVRTGLSADDSNPVFTAVMWHIGAYVVERTSLTIILDSRRRSSKHGHQSQGSDAWLSCLGMLALLGLLSPSASRHFSLLDRVMIMCLGLVLYVCMTVTSDALANGYFIDDVLGLAVLVTIAASDFASSSVM